MDKETKENLSRLLKVSLTCNQLLLLREIRKSKLETLSQLLRRVSVLHDIPLSTLKSCSIALRKRGLIDYDKFKAVRLTKAGELVLLFLGDEDGRSS